MTLSANCSAPLHSFNRAAGDWMRLACGDRVRERGDPRHKGRVEAIRSGHEVKVAWDNGWGQLRATARPGTGTN
jgi:hypothetical protein